LTSFVGRDEELSAIATALEEWRLVTLTGTGGVGKTRLAVQVAAEVVERFAGGAWFCELAAVDDGDAMSQAVATTLGCQQRVGLSLAESVVEFLKVRELLLVLDNCEHLLDEAGALADAVVRSCPKVRVLVTSREALEVAGERVLRVRSLPAPAESTRGLGLLESAAVQLFADRAADAGADTEHSTERVHDLRDRRRLQVCLAQLRNPRLKQCRVETPQGHMPESRDDVHAKYALVPCSR
jgi:predicted ATPase